MTREKLMIGDLMIGDWVNFLIDIEGGDTEYDPAVNEYQPMRVDGIFSFGDVVSELGVINDVTQLRPIPLTTEILKKNGFMCIEACLKPKYAKYVCRNICVIFADNNFVSIPPCLGMKCDYVHELQHALHLCDIEKKIEL